MPRCSLSISMSKYVMFDPPCVSSRPCAVEMRLIALIALPVSLYGSSQLVAILLSSHLPICGLLIFSNTLFFYFTCVTKFMLQEASSFAIDYGNALPAKKTCLNTV